MTHNAKKILLFMQFLNFSTEWYVIAGFVVNGINNVNTSTLERRYQLPSSRVGLISSSYDIVAAILIIPLTYYGAHAHQPRMLALGALVMSFGSCIMALPQFTVGNYQLGPRHSDSCDVYGKCFCPLFQPTELSRLSQFTILLEMLI